jgi:tetratricopeptide (TPR) repeat protein
LGGRAAIVVAAVVCGLTAIYLGINAHDATLVKRANEQGLHHRYAQALDTAARVKHPPADARALLVTAYALRDQGRLPAASAAFSRAANRDPNNYEIHFNWALLLLRLGERSAAGREMGRAVELNPRLVPPLPFVVPKRPGRARS